MYSFAAPRVCEEPFADAVATRTTSGSDKYVFRIVYGEDPVPTVPPAFGSQVDKYPFVHVDGGWHLYSDRGPQQMPSERPPNKPVPPMSITGWVWNIKDHSVYYFFTRSFKEALVAHTDCCDCPFYLQGPRTTTRDGRTPHTRSYGGENH